MKIIKIPKKQKGEFRTICVPSNSEKYDLKSLLPTLNEKCQKMCDAESVQGFMLGKSPVTNAKLHIGYRFTLCFDIKDFFDSVKFEQVRGKLSARELNKVFVANRAWQGLPTSPAVANLAAMAMDDAIKKYLNKKYPNRVMYTRYADDLSFSFNFYWIYEDLLKNIPIIVGRCNFTINSKKTRLQDGNYGFRNITGISVGFLNIKIPRSIKRRIRAARFQKNTEQLRGLEEWAKLKTPKSIINSFCAQNELDNLTKHWQLKKVNKNKIPYKDHEILNNNIIITGDSAYILGMSNFTTNWTSCMVHPNGAHRRGVRFWLFLPGTQIAALLSDETLTINGVTRRKMKARCLVHKFRNGQKAYDRIYAENEASRQMLSAGLIAHGLIDVKTIKGPERVVGNVPFPCSIPYGDSLCFERKVNKKGKKVLVAQRNV